MVLAPQLAVAGLSVPPRVSVVDLAGTPLCACGQGARWGDFCSECIDGAVVIRQWALPRTVLTPPVRTVRHAAPRPRAEDLPAEWRDGADARVLAGTGRHRRTAPAARELVTA